MTITFNGLLHILLSAVAPDYAARIRLEQRFNEIVRLHDNLIIRLCFGYARDASELDDLHQDALINIWRGLPRFSGEASLKTWIYRVTLNTCVSSFRTRTRNVGSIPVESIVETPDNTDDTMSIVKDIHAAIGLLSSTDKAIMLLWLEEMSYEEIASLTGLTKSAVGVRIHRARQKLKNIL